MSWAFRQTTVPSGPRFVLVALADHANEDAEAWPSVETIGGKTGQNATTVRRGLRWLEEAGLITCVGKRGKRADHSPNCYRLNMAGTISVQEPKLEATGGHNARAGKLHGRALRPSRAGTMPAEPSIEPSLSPSPVPSEVSKEARGSRLPPDWKPSPELLAWAAEARPDVDAAAEAEAFRDYWHAKPGAAARKVDWSLTFKTWIRRSNGFRRPAAGNSRPPKLTIEEQRRADRLAVLEGLGLKVAGDGGTDPGEGGGGDFEDAADLARFVGSGRA